MATAVYTTFLTDSPQAIGDQPLPADTAPNIGAASIPTTPALTNASTLSSLSASMDSGPSIDGNASIDAVDAYDAVGGWVLAQSIEERQKQRDEAWAQAMEDLQVRKANARARRLANRSPKDSTVDPNERLKKILAFLKGLSNANSYAIQVPVDGDGEVGDSVIAPNASSRPHLAC